MARNDRAGSRRRDADHPLVQPTGVQDMARRFPPGPASIWRRRPVGAASSWRRMGSSTARPNNGTYSAGTIFKMSQRRKGHQTLMTSQEDPTVTGPTLPRFRAQKVTSTEPLGERRRHRMGPLTGSRSTATSRCFTISPSAMARARGAAWSKAQTTTSTELRIGWPLWSRHHLPGQLNR